MKYYFRGLGKGLGIFLISLVLLSIPVLFLPENKKDAATNISGSILWLTFFAYNLYLINKYKLPKSFNLLAFLGSLFITPFLLGLIELNKSKVKN